MGAVLDFYILSNVGVPMDALFAELRKGGYCTVKIKKVSVFDSFCDSNNENAITTQEIPACLDDGCTITVELETEHFLSAGIYLEKTKFNDYISNFWVNTEPYSELDNAITTQNRHYYNLFYEIVSRLIKAGVIVSYKLIAIGIEGELEYNNSFEKILESSYNINAWIIDDRLEWSKKINGYVKKSTDIPNSLLFEKEQVTN